jgi:2-polyprenyl-6-methoxyphenol hydroxylase-like FAD-dependent oxidoreductase
MLPSTAELPTTTDVLIVGAGPTGLALAVSLAARGHDVTVVDAQAEGANTSRAAVVHARTLEALEPYGVSERLAAEGIHAPRFTVRDRDRVLLTIPFDTIPSDYPYTLMVSQAVTEAVLLERLTELGGRVLRPHRLTSLGQDDEGVTAMFAGGDELRARYLVAADGMHSTVREQAGIGFIGSQYGESFVLADVRLDGAVPDDEAVLYFSPEGVLVVAPLPGGAHRIVATVAEAPERPDAELVQDLLDARGPAARRTIVDEVLWGSRFLVHHRIADRYRAGRVLLAGDAAHVHSPAGGQGMNTGITDAVTLGDVLARVLDGGSADLLDEYGAVRRPVARQVVAFTDRMTRLAGLDRRLRRVRNLVIGVLAHNPIVRRELAWRLSGLVYR